MDALIVGLGNPGEKYQNSRHNTGWLAVDKLAEKLNAQPWHNENRFSSQVATADFLGKKVILAKPQTFMNKSGVAVRAILDYYKLLPKKLKFLTTKDADLGKKLIVIHDDIDIGFGECKIQVNRSSGGHNGVNSIIEHLKTQNFTRVRIGVATERKEKMPADKFVLENFSVDEMEQLKIVIKKVGEEIINCISCS
ncbi:MAG: aminoacyl-tRNA hydrolase [bacterium]|nr:aminoacyl-tRNA hydrolase [bacterium]